MGEVSVVDTDIVAALLERGAQAIEVLPQAEYDGEHLPSAL